MSIKITTNYKQKHTVEELHKFSSLFIKLLKEEIENTLPVFEVTPPLYSTSKISSDITQNLISRNVTFGTATDSELYIAYNDYSYWMRNTLTNLKVESNSGIYTFVDFIKRDSLDNNNEIIRNRKILIEMKYSGKTQEERMLEISSLILNSIINSIKKTSRTLSIKSKSKIQYKEFDFIYDKLDLNNPEVVINDYTKKYSVATFINHNSRIKRKIYKSDNEEYLTTKTWSQSSKESTTIINTGYRQKMSNINNKIRQGILDPKDEFHFSKEILNKKTVDSIYVEMDINKILVWTLNLAYVGEIMPDTQSPDNEILLKNNNIKHM